MFLELCLTKVMNQTAMITYKPSFSEIVGLHRFALEDLPRCATDFGLITEWDGDWLLCLSVLNPYRSFSLNHFHRHQNHVKSLHFVFGAHWVDMSIFDSRGENTSSVPQQLIQGWTNVTIEIVFFELDERNCALRVEVTAFELLQVVLPILGCFQVLNQRSIFIRKNLVLFFTFVQAFHHIVLYFVPSKPSNLG